MPLNRQDKRASAWIDLCIDWLDIRLFPEPDFMG